eukprot:gene9149-1237_t
MKMTGFTIKSSGPTVGSSIIGRYTNYTLSYNSGNEITKFFGTPSLYNAQYNIQFPCVMNESTIQYCYQENMNINETYVSISLSLRNETYIFLESFSLDFFEANDIVSVFPESGSTYTKVFIVFSEKTLQPGTTYYCSGAGRIVVGTFVNETALSCSSISSNLGSGLFEYDISIATITGRPSIATFKFLFGEKQQIYEIGDGILLRNPSNFSLNFLNSLPQEFNSTLKCSLATGGIFRAAYINSNEIECIDVNMTQSKEDLTLVFIYKGVSSILSTNSLSIEYSEKFNISYGSGIKSISFSSTMNSVKLDSIISFTGNNFRLKCSLNDTLYPITKIGNQYSCNINSGQPGVHNLSLIYLKPKLFTVKGVPGYFLHKTTLEINSTNSVKPNIIRIATFSTLTLINQQKIKNGDCSDVIVVYNGIQIPRYLSCCTCSFSDIRFVSQHNETFSRNYTIYYGNYILKNPLTSTLSYVYSFDPLFIDSIDDRIQLSTNQLKFISINFLDLSDILQPNSIFHVPTNITVNVPGFSNLQGNVNFNLTYGGNSQRLTLSNQFLSTSLSNESQQIVSAKIVAEAFDTGDVLVISNSKNLNFWNPVDLNVMNPFSISPSTSSYSSSFQIYTKTNLVTNEDLFCKITYKNQTTYSDTISVTSTRVQCSFLAISLTENLERAVFELYVNNSQGGFTISPNNLTMVYSKNPHPGNRLPNIIDSTYFLKNYTIEFEDLIGRETVVYDSYVLNIIPSSTFISTQSFCQHFHYFSECTFPVITTNIYVAEELRFYLYKKSSVLGVSYLSPFNTSTLLIFEMSKHVQFIIDYPSYDSQETIIVRMAATKHLNPTYIFACDDSTEIKNATKLYSNSEFSCEFQIKKSENVSSIRFYLDHPLLNQKNEMFTKIVYTKILYSNNLFEFDDIFHFTVLKNITERITIPKYYNSTEFRLTDMDKIQISCFHQNLELFCSKVQFPISLSHDIFSVAFSLQLKENILNVGNNMWNDVTKINERVLVFKNNSISILKPLAVLDQQNLTLRVDFDASTFNIKNESYSILCKNSTRYWNAVIKSSKSIECFIPFVSSNSLEIDVVLKAPNFTQKDIYLSKSPHEFHYLPQKNIKFTDSNAEIVKYDVDFLIVNISTFVKVPPSLINKIECMLTLENGYTSSISYIGRISGFDTFQCAFQIVTIGVQNISLWFNDGISKFPISSNTLEVVVLKRSKIDFITPIGMKVNTTQKIKIQTNFTTDSNYDSNHYFCHFTSFENSPIQINATTNSSIPGLFSCTINDISFKIGFYFLNVWIHTKGIEKQLTFGNASFEVKNENFFEPCYGKPEGGTEMFIKNYKGNFSNVVFGRANLTDKYLFNCTILSTDLRCVSPSISLNDVILYTSLEIMFLDARTISTAFIFYDTLMVLDYYPKVVESTKGIFKMNVTLSKQLTISEGLLYVAYGSNTIYDKRFSYGTLNSTNFEMNVQSIESDGVFTLDLHYFNPKSLEPRSMILISNKSPVTFTGFSVISLISNQDIFGINDRRNVTLRIEELTKLHLTNEQLNSIKCKWGNKFIPTFQILNDTYNCEIHSSQRKFEKLNLFFISKDGSDGEVKLSESVIDIMVNDVINITSVVPFATIEKNFTVELNSDYDNLYNHSVYYQCNFGSKRSNATLIGKNVFMCIIEKEGSGIYSTNISLIMISKLKNFEVFISKAPLLFYFLNQFSFKSISSFGHVYQTNTKISKNITLEITGTLLTVKETYCRFQTIDEGVKYFPLQNLSKIQCTIEKNNFVSVLDVYDIDIWINASSSYQISLTSKPESYLFVKQSIGWKSENLINSTILDPILNMNSIQRDTIKYELIMNSVEPTNSSTIVNCNYFNTYPQCFLSHEYIENLNYVPLRMNFILNITHIPSSRSMMVGVHHLSYYRTLTIEHLKPFVIQLYQFQFSPLPLILNTEKYINSDFNVKCHVIQGDIRNSFPIRTDLKINELQPGIETKSQFACEFLTNFGTSGNYSIEISAEIDSRQIMLTNKSATIHIIDELLLPKLNGFSSGRSILQFLFPIEQETIFPTSIYQDYIIALTVEDIDGSQLSGNNCSVEQNMLNCTVPSVESFYKSDNFSKLMDISLTINSQRAVQFYPSFLFHSEIVIKRYSPSQYFPINSTGDIIFTTNFMNLFDFKVRVKYENQFDEIMVKLCQILSPVRLKCPRPGFSKAGEVDVYFSINEVDYAKTTSLFIQDVNPTLISINEYIQDRYFTDIYLIGTGFLNSSEIFIRFYDNYVNNYEKAMFINSTHLYTNLISFQDFNITFPRELKISVTFDHGITQTFSSFTTSILSPVSISLIPNEFKTLSHIEFNASSLLTANIGIQNPTKLHIDAVENPNQNTFVEFDCIKDFSKCISKSQVSVSGSFKLIVSQLINEKWTPLFLNTKYIEIYAMSLSVSSYNVIPTKMTETISLVGNNMFNGDFSMKLYKGTDYVITKNITFIDKQVMKFIFPAFNMTPGSGYRLSLSTNNFVDEHLISSSMYVIETPIITALYNDEYSEKLTFFSFKRAATKLSGFKFPTLTLFKNLVRIRIRSELVDSVSTLISPSYTENTISFSAPLINDISFTSSSSRGILSYPAPMTMEFSFDKGLHYSQAFDILYIDRYSQLLLYAVTPNILHGSRKTTVTIQGLEFQNVTHCVVYVGKGHSDSAFTYKVPKQEINGTDTNLYLSCDLTISNIGAYVELALLNEHSEYSSRIVLSIISIPTFTQYIPTSGIAFGGNTMTIYGSGFSSIQPVLKFDSIESEPCIYRASNRLTCIVPSHPEGFSKVFLSWNKHDWFSPTFGGSQEYYFEPCIIGQGADNYSVPCQNCSLGTYKPTIGLYQCLDCEKGSYGSISGSATCLKCPERSTSLNEGLKDVLDCICDVGYYQNPGTYNDIIDKCNQCPEGAICSKKNLTVPIAKPGYWFSSSDVNSFYKCKPAISCSGGGSENCTIGYENYLCGVCQRDFYKSKGRCYPCQDGRKKDRKSLRKLRHDLQKEKETSNENFKEEYNYNEEIKEETTDEDKTKSMNQIIFDIFSFNRLKKNVALLDKKRKNIQQKVTAKVVQVTQVDLEDYDSESDESQKERKSGFFQNVKIGSKADKEIDHDDLMSKIYESIGVNENDPRRKTLRNSKDVNLVGIDNEVISDPKRNSVFVSLGLRKKKVRNSKDITFVHEKVPETDETIIEEIL